MTSSTCEKCGRPQVHKDGVGYVAGCAHYPPEHCRMVDVYFGGDNESPTRAFYLGAWYKSVKAQREGRAVHPVEWRDE